MPRDNPRERLWLVERSGNASTGDLYSAIVGSVAIVEATPEEAQLRWLLLLPELRGRGVGRYLMDLSLRFSEDCGYRRVFLWTTSDLEQAAKLYLASGFALTVEETHSIWGKTITEQKYVKSLPATR